MLEKENYELGREKNKQRRKKKQTQNREESEKQTFFMPGTEERA